MNVRPAIEADIEGIRAVGEDGWWGTYAGYRTPEYIQRALDRWWSADYLRGVIGSERHVLLVAEDRGRIIGVAESALLDDNTAMLWKLYVLEDERGKGVGTALLEESIRRFPPEIEEYRTEYDSKNDRAAAFYASRGFTPESIEELDFQGRPVVSIYVKRRLTETPDSS